SFLFPLSFSNQFSPSTINVFVLFYLIKNRIRDQESELERVRVYQLQMDECQAELTATHSLLVDSARDLAITRQGLQSLQEICDPLLSLAKELDNY
ncbi:MAG: hypothetical protein Q8P67_01390, partial [archaeon]|nr:hypothetical protein [archaeon]